MKERKMIGKLLMVPIIALIGIVNVQSQSINPYVIVEPEEFDSGSGAQIVGTANISGVAFTDQDDFIVFDDVDFSNGPVSGGVRASSATSGGVIEFRLGAVDGPLLATSTITNTGTWTNLEIFPITVVDPTIYSSGIEFLGNQTLYLVFVGSGNAAVALEKFRFNTTEVPITEIMLFGCPTGDAQVGELINFSGQSLPSFPSNPAVFYSTDNGDFIDPFTGEFLPQTPGEVTVRLSSVGWPDVFDECTFTVVEPDDFRVLIFHKTNGFRHGSINAGISMIEDFGIQNDWIVEESQNSDIFNEENLADVDVVVWLNTSGNNLLTGAEQDAFEAYIQNGGGFVGFHAATDTYRNGSWPWYNDLVGAIVQTGPNHTSNNFNATMDVVGDHPAVEHLGIEWNKNEEYYYWELNGGYLFDGNIDLLQVRSTGNQSYDAPRPITWYKEYDGGRSFYTALGHNSGDYNNDDEFKTMAYEAIRWAGGLTEVSSQLAVQNEDHGSAFDILAFPNPTKDQIQFYGDPYSAMEIRLFDIRGTLLSAHRVRNGVAIYMSNLSPGLYLAQVTQSGKTVQLKVVKE
ncbi:MAG: ThuA domain-containing protein [Bacteroidota bacterium]